MVLFTIVMYSMMASRCKLEQLKATMAIGQSLVDEHQSSIPESLLEPSRCPIVKRTRDLANQILKRIRTFGLRHKECQDGILQYAGVKLTRDHLKKRMQNGYEPVTADVESPTTSFEEPTIQNMLGLFRDGQMNIKWAKIILLIVGLIAIGAAYGITDFHFDIKVSETNMLLNAYKTNYQHYLNQKSEFDANCFFQFNPTCTSNHHENVIESHLGICNPNLLESCNNALANGCQITQYGSKSSEACALNQIRINQLKNQLDLQQIEPYFAKSKVIFYTFLEIGEYVLLGIVLYYLGMEIEKIINNLI
eukprot:NODE_45_length_32908_cov_0.790271.p12 type:complete len:307 gc:universal NODE_45_length_32908_cov_0.790271:22370-21450(-)